MNFDEAMLNRLKQLEREVERLKVKETPRWVMLAAPLTSTSWDGDSFSTTAKTLIDLSAVFSAPAGVKAILVHTAIRDSASASGLCYLVLSPVDTDYFGPNYTIAPRNTNNEYTWGSGIVPCDANGDIYYQIVASGTNTFDVILQIWGYWL